MTSECAPPGPDGGPGPLSDVPLRLPPPPPQLQQLQPLAGQAQGDQAGHRCDLQTSLWLWQEIRCGWIND